MEESEFQVVREFRESVNRGSLAAISVVYRISGGVPGERLDEELIQARKS